MSKNPKHDRVKTRGGGARAVYTMCKKSSILVEDGFPKLIRVCIWPGFSSLFSTLVFNFFLNFLWLFPPTFFPCTCTHVPGSWIWPPGFTSLVSTSFFNFFWLFWLSPRFFSLHMNTCIWVLNLAGLYNPASQLWSVTSLVLFWLLPQFFSRAHVCMYPAAVYKPRLNSGQSQVSPPVSLRPLHGHLPLLWQKCDKKWKLFGWLCTNMLW